MAVRYLDEEPPISAEAPAPRGRVTYLDQPAVAEVVPAPVVTPEQQLVQQYIQAQQAPVLDQIISKAIEGGSMVSGVAETIGSGAAGYGEILGRASVPGISDQRTVSQAIQDALIGRAVPGLQLIPGGVATARRAIPDLAQTGLETVGRTAVDLGGLIGEAVRTARERPQVFVEGLTRMTPGVNVIGELGAMIPRTPTQQEAESAVAAQQQAAGEAVLAEQPLVPEVFGTANVPLARAAPFIAALPEAVAPLSAVARTVASPITKPVSRMTARGFTTPTVEKASGLLGVTESEGLLDILSVAPPRIREAIGKSPLPRTAKATVQAAEKAERNVIDKTISTLRQAQDEGLVMKGDTMLAEGRAAVSNDFPLMLRTPEGLSEIDNVLTRFNALKGEIPPVQGQTFLRQLNNDYDRLIDKSSPEASVYRAVRNSLSNQLDDIYKATSKLDESPYRDWGKIRQFKLGVQNRIRQAESAAGEAAVPVSAESGGIGIPRTTGGALARSITGRLARGTRILRKQGIEFVDEASEAVIKDSPRRQKIANIPEEQVTFLREQYSTAPPVISTVAPEVALEAQIQAAINSLPREMRGAQERSIAEAIVRSGQAP